jgi:membrane protein YdbS with pleckstrin-like domain
LLRPGGLLALCLLGGLFIIAFMGDAQLFAFVGCAVLLVALGWFGWITAEWYTERFAITDKRVLLVNGLLTRRVAIMPLTKVTDLTFERSILGRMLGYGVFVMESAGQQQALSRIDYLPTPDKLYRDVSTLLFGPKPAAPPTPTDPAQPGVRGGQDTGQQSTTRLPGNR